MYLKHRLKYIKPNSNFGCAFATDMVVVADYVKYDNSRASTLR